MKEQGREEATGMAKITGAYNMPCKYVLHTVGPIISGTVTRKDEQLLVSCYRSCLELAERHGVRSIAFCCISTGEFHFPNDRAAEIAVRTVRAYRAENKGNTPNLSIWRKFYWMQSVAIPFFMRKPMMAQKLKDRPELRSIQSTKRSPTNQSLTMKNLNESRFFTLTIGLKADDQGNSIAKEVWLIL